MAEPKTRSDRTNYPGCECILIPPVPGAWNKTWAQAQGWAMGAVESGHSGVLTGGKLLCSCTAAEMTTWGEGI